MGRTTGGRKRRNRRIGLIAGIALIMAWGTVRAAAAAAPVDFPPGVTLEPLPASDRFPVGYDGQAIGVDWTNPLLKVGLENGLEAGNGTAIPWSRLERNRPGALRIQLLEPEESTAGWSLPLAPLAAREGAAEERPAAPAVDWIESHLRQQFYFSFGPLCSWLPLNPEMLDRFGWIGPLTADDTWIPARWLGRREGLDAVPDLEFRPRAVLSWTTPAKGRSRFGVIQRKGDEPGSMADLRRWLVATLAEDEWLGLHSRGDDALVGMGEWRLTGSSPPRRVERAGLALTLDGVKPGEPVDWARLRGCRIRASSFEGGCRPEWAASGRLWPAPLSPNVWMSRPEDDGDQPPWLEVVFDAPRPVSRVVVVWASAAGWSSRFDPRQASLEAATGTEAGTVTLAEVKDPPSPCHVWQWREPVRVKSLRLVLREPTRLTRDRRGRIAAFQAWGPWDGATRPR